jgi:hypothetical protein
MTLPIQVIADFQSPIADWQVVSRELPVKALCKGSITIGNWQSEIVNWIQLAIGNRQ